MLKETPNYIKSLLLPTAKSPRGRRVWSIDLETVWLPFLTATNTMGDTAIPADALGSPIRLAYEKDGSVKFSRSGRPITKVAKPISESVTLVRQNFVANLLQYAEDVANSRKDAFAKWLEIANKAGQPIIAHDEQELSNAIQLRLEADMRQQAEAEAVATEAETEKEPVAV